MEGFCGEADEHGGKESEAKTDEEKEERDRLKVKTTKI